VQVTVSSRTMAAGSTMTAHIIVDNRTGHAIHVNGCGAPFALVLESNTYHPEVAWPACLQTLTIAVGKSTYPDTLTARYDQCGPPGNHGSTHICVHGQPPALPAGDYRVVLFQPTQVVPAPAPIPVRVTPA